MCTKLGLVQQLLIFKSECFRICFVLCILWLYFLLIKYVNLRFVSKISHLQLLDNFLVKERIILKYKYLQNLILN